MPPPPSTSLRLLKVISKPSKVASALDWKKFGGSTILSLDIHKDRIGLALASHPSYGHECWTLKSISFKENHISVDKDCIDHLSKIVQDHKVCGMVVAWPLQSDTGKMGAACGRVLYTLERMLEKNDQQVLTPSRPLCLWDSDHRIPDKSAEDDFGRCALYSKTSNQTEHRATKEQYFQDEQVVAAQVWDDFCKVHWPELYYKADVHDGEMEEIKVMAPLKLRVAPLQQHGTSWKNIPFRKENNKSAAPEKQAMDVYGLANKKRSLIHVRV
jgi:RNase H-fold protein (predicted Holliday junction resolvase)